MVVQLRAQAIVMHVFYIVAGHIIHTYGRLRTCREMTLTAGPWVMAPYPADDLCVIDCLPFHDPTSEELREHAGVHPAMIDGVIGHTAKLRSVFESVLHHLATVENPRLYTACKAGRHRCVAVLTVLRICLSSTYGDQLKMHIAYADFDNFSKQKKRCVTGQCQECKASPQRVAEALELWQQVMDSR